MIRFIDAEIPATCWASLCSNRTFLQTEKELTRSGARLITTWTEHNIGAKQTHV